MKKLIAILFVILLSCDTALAGTVVVKLNNAGRVSGHRVGAGIHQRFGRNALYAPTTNRLIIQRNRQRRYEDALINSLNRGNCCYRSPMAMATSAASVAPEPISRFDKSYKIKTPTSYTKGGVTYYN